MAKIEKVIEIPLDSLFVGKGQVRVSEVGKDIDELASSIAKIGLLEPIVVSPPDEDGQYEILTGQRRFLAHQRLNRGTILAGVLDARVDETTAKVISITENLVRRDLNRRDLITACTALYKKYGSVKDVCEETGLSPNKVREYVKYDRLAPALRSLVDNGLSLKVALRAQDAASVGHEFDAEEAVKLAKEMAGMTGVMRDKLVETIEQNPGSSVDDAIEQAKTGGTHTQMIITIGPSLKTGLQKLADDEGTNAGDAAVGLIQEGLFGKGYLGESS
jgi:ParB family transcriptional regulator, chromosome partitioning protein